MADQTEVATLYTIYPRKAAKPEALKAIANALTRATYAELLEAVTAFAAATKTWSESDRGFIPHPATWFNKDRWTDDRETWKRTSNGKQTRDLTGGAGVTHDPTAKETVPNYGKM